MKPEVGLAKLETEFKIVLSDLQRYMCVGGGLVIPSFTKLELLAHRESSECSNKFFRQSFLLLSENRHFIDL